MGKLDSLQSKSRERHFNKSLKEERLLCSIKNKLLKLKYHQLPAIKKDSELLKAIIKRDIFLSRPPHSCIGTTTENRDLISKERYIYQEKVFKYLTNG